jgi:hypothetical protein
MSMRRRPLLNAEIDRELDLLREELVDELREHWLRDDRRWARWGRSNRLADWDAAYEAIVSERLDRINHNDLARAHIHRIRALDAVRVAAAGAQP